MQHTSVPTVRKTLGVKRRHVSIAPGQGTGHVISSVRNVAVKSDARPISDSSDDERGTAASASAATPAAQRPKHTAAAAAPAAASLAARTVVTPVTKSAVKSAASPVQSSIAALQEPARTPLASPAVAPLASQPAPSSTQRNGVAKQSAPAQPTPSSSSQPAEADDLPPLLPLHDQAAMTDAPAASGAEQPPAASIKKRRGRPPKAETIANKKARSTPTHNANEALPAAAQPVAPSAATPARPASSSSAAPARGATPTAQSSIAAATSAVSAHAGSPATSVASKEVTPGRPPAKQMPVQKARHTVTKKASAVGQRNSASSPIPVSSDSDTLSFACPSCSRTFTSANGLRMHATVHAEKRFTCSHHGCEQAFSVKHMLTRHERTHGIEVAAGSETESESSSDERQTTKKKVPPKKPPPQKRAATTQRSHSSADDDEESEASEASVSIASVDSTPPARISAPTAPPRRTAAGRELRPRRADVSYAVEEMPDAYAFVEPIWFNSEHAQPFRVEVDPLVHVMLDVHAHLLHTEIIGLMGGVFDEKKKLLRILSAHPCNTLETGNDHLNVELDPVSQIEVSEAIAALGQQTVGWYHSHPLFANDPSTIDVQNQMSYQAHFHGSDCTPSPPHLSQLRPVDGMVPFVAAIITPYGRDHFRPLPSSIKYFSTISHRERRRLQARMSTTKGASTQRDEADGALKQNGRRAKSHVADDDGVDVAIELWTSVKRTLPRGKPAAAGASSATAAADGTRPAAFVTGTASSLQARIDALIGEYQSLPQRVNFQRRWQPNDHAEEEGEGEEEASTGSSDDEGSEGSDAPNTRRRPSKATGSPSPSKSPGASRSIADLMTTRTAPRSSPPAAAAATRQATGSQAASDPDGSDANSDAADEFVKPSSYIATKLDQFVHSLSGHLLALESDGTKKSVHLLSSGAHRSTAGLPSRATGDQFRSPFYGALQPAHQKFVRAIMRRVAVWKVGEEAGSDDDGDVDDDGDGDGDDDDVDDDGSQEGGESEEEAEGEAEDEAVAVAEDPPVVVKPAGNVNAAARTHTAGKGRTGVTATDTDTDTQVTPPAKPTQPTRTDTAVTARRAANTHDNGNGNGTAPSAAASVRSSPPSAAGGAKKSAMANAAAAAAQEKGHGNYAAASSPRPAPSLAAAAAADDAPFTSSPTF